MVSVLWGDAEDKQLETLELLYKCTVPHCALGDWELGYQQTVMDEDGLAALIDMCSCVAEKVPVLPIYVLLHALNDPESEHLHLTRISHVLIKFGQRCVALHLHFLPPDMVCLGWFQNPCNLHMMPATISFTSLYASPE
jgi:hypothetical protein